MSACPSTAAQKRTLSDFREVLDSDHSGPVRMSDLPLVTDIFRLHAQVPKVQKETLLCISGNGALSLLDASMSYSLSCFNLLVWLTPSEG